MLEQNATSVCGKIISSNESKKGNVITEHPEKMRLTMIV